MDSKQRRITEHHVERFFFGVGQIFETGEVKTTDFEDHTRQRLEAVLAVLETEKKRRQRRVSVG